MTQLLRWLIRRVFGRRCISVKGEAGVPLRYPPAEYPSLLLGLKRAKPQIRREWELLLRPDEVILDIGANIGVTVQRFFALLNGKCSIWAFEPIPRNFKILEVNAQALGTDRVFVSNVAVTDEDGEIRFLNNIKHGALSRMVSTTETSKQLQSFYWQDYEECIIPAITLDRFLKDHPEIRPTFVKIDAQGAGANVLRGSARMLEQYKPVVHCRMHDPAEKADSSAVMKQAGYQVVAFHANGGFSLCECDDPLDGYFIHPDNPR